MAVPLKQKQNKVTYLPKARHTVSKKKRLPLLLLLSAFIYFSVLFAGQYWRLAQVRHSLVDIQTEIETVKKQNAAMGREIERLHSPSYIEQMAREELGMVRSGELLFYLQGRDNPSASSAGQE